MQTVIQYGLIITSFCFWFYIDNKKIFDNKIVNSSLIHAIISGLGHGIGIFCEPNIVLDYSSVANNISYMYKIIPLISVGYSLYDLYLGIKGKKIDHISHGLIFVFMFSYMYFTNIILSSHGIMLVEISSIFLNLRPYRKKWIDLSFAISFFMFRIIICPIFLYLYITNPNNTEKFVIFIGGSSITLLNLYWFYFIMFNQHFL